MSTLFAIALAMGWAMANAGEEKPKESASATRAKEQAATADEAPVERRDVGSLEVYVDVKPECPRRGCWAVTCEALQRMNGVKWVDAGVGESALLRVNMAEKGLPDPTEWERQFREYVGTASEFRGVIVSLTGTLSESEKGLILETEGAANVRLMLGRRELRLGAEPVTSIEAVRVKALGVLRKKDGLHALEVRELSIVKERSDEAADGTPPRY